MKKTLMIIVITVIATIVVLAVVGSIAQSGKGSDNEKAKVVRMACPERGRLVEYINAPGEVRPKRKVEISAKISARIMDLPFREGDQVFKGDPTADPPVPASVVLRLDDSNMRASLESVQARRDAQLAQMEVARTQVEIQQSNMEAIIATHEQAGRELERQQSLLASKDVSQSSVDSALSRYEELTAQLAGAQSRLKSSQQELIVLKHNLQAAEAEIRQAKENLNYTVISAPMDGVITRLNAEEGEMVMTGTMNNPGTVIMRIADLSTMLVEAQVDEADIGKVKTGSRAQVHIQAWPDVVFQGQVTQTALSHDIGREGSKYYKTEILLDQMDRQIYSGLTADVDIEIARYEDVLTLPSQAVLGRKVDELPSDIREKLSEEEKKKVLTTVVYCCQDGKTVIKPVEVGASDNTRTIIRSGLEPQDQVVVGPYKELEGLKHDQKVKDEKEKQAEEKEAAEKKKAEEKSEEKAEETKETEKAEEKETTDKKEQEKNQ